MFQHLPKIYSIEEKDKAIDNNISEIIKEFNSALEEFKEAIEHTKLSEKEFQVKHLKKIISSIKTKLEKLSFDINRILRIENFEKDYINIKDYYFIRDKMDQIERIKENIKMIEGILKEDPPAEEFKTELFEAMKNDINTISSSLNQIIHDDTNLEKIYERITNL